MPRLKLQGAVEELSYELPQNGRFRVGRSKHCDLQLNHASVSEQHCEIYLDPLVVMLTDLGSTNGTFLDGNPVQKIEVNNGQVMHIGAYALRFELESQQVSIPVVHFGQVEHPTVLANGAPCCYEHPEVQAAMRCSNCHRTFCSACVRRVGLKGGAQHYHCPQCHRNCEVFVWEGDRARQGLFGEFVKVLKKMTGRLRN